MIICVICVLFKLAICKDEESKVIPNLAGFLMCNIP